MHVPFGTRIICQMMNATTSDEIARQDANAQLISCAPEMLTMLELFKDVLNGVVTPTYDDLTAVEKLLTKIRGE